MGEADLGSALQNRTNDPNNTGENDRPLSTQAIGELCYGEGAYQRTGGHGSYDSALGIRVGLIRL